MTKYSILAFLFLFFATISLAQTRVQQFDNQQQADSAYSDWTNNVLDLDQVVVTGTRTPKNLKNVPVLTRVISANDIKKSDATNIQDLLQQELPGVEFSYSMNQKVNMNLAGFSGQSVLFLIDGERMAGEIMENVDFSRLDMNNVERIEIVKGAASALYGSNASGGVINIITKDGTKGINENFQYKIGLNSRFANHNEQRYNALLSCSKNKFANTLSINRNSIDTYDVVSAPNPESTIFSTVFGYETWNFKDQIQFRPIKSLKISGRAGYFFRETTRTENEPERYRDFSAGLRAVYEPSTSNNLEIAYSFDQYDKSDYQQLRNLDIRDYSNVQNSIRALYNHSFVNDNILTFGADYMYDFIMNYYFSDGDHHQNNVDFFAQFDFKLFNNFEIVSALRYDYFSDGSDNRLTPKFSVRYRLNRFNFRTSYSMGFRAPTLKEKYTNFDMLSIWILEGNPDLMAEKSQSCNASLEWTKSHYNISLSCYYNFVKDRISTTSPMYHDNGDRYIKYINLDNMNVYGAEFSAMAKWNNSLGAKVSYSFCHEDYLNKNINQIMPARPHSVTIKTDYDYKISPKFAINIALSGRILSAINNDEYADILDDNSMKTIHYPAYTIWKFQTTSHIMKRFSATFTVDNIFDYKPKYYYYNAPLTTGANFMFGVGVEL